MFTHRGGMVVVVALAAALSGCGGDGAGSAGTSAAPGATSSSATSPAEPASPTTAETLSAPPSKGPFTKGGKAPALELSKSAVTLPDEVGPYGRTSDDDTFSLYEREGQTGIASIQVMSLTIDAVAASLKDPVDYGDFICGQATIGHSGLGCYVGLTDGHIVFSDSQGPNASIEGSAGFTAAAITALGS